MCAWTPCFTMLCSGLLVLLVSSTLVQASSYMRSHGPKELWHYFRIRCDLKCPYGYKTDVEGNHVCLCHDPCLSVKCFDRTCVVDLPKTCLLGEYCRPIATCKDLGHHVPPVTTSENSVPQADDAATTTAGASVPERCLLPVTDEAKKCRRTRVRWYYDNVTGTCKSFLGCKTMRNNFRGQRGCEKTCLVKNPAYKNRHRLFRTQADDASSLVPTQQPRVSRTRAVCSLPAITVTTGCRKVRRRWFFDRASGTCKKFRSCRTYGNSFSKKRYCKQKCINSRSSRRKGRGKRTLVRVVQ